MDIDAIASRVIARQRIIAAATAWRHDPQNHVTLDALTKAVDALEALGQGDITTRAAESILSQPGIRAAFDKLADH